MASFKTAKTDFLHRLLKYIIGDELERQATELVQKNCNGCLIGHPSQLQHDCVELDELQYVCYYEQAIASLNLSYIQAVFTETANIRRLDSSLIDFERFAAEALTIWANKEFRDGPGISDGPELLRDFRRTFPFAMSADGYPSEDAVIAVAREKVKRLEQRLSLKSSAD